MYSQNWFETHLMIAAEEARRMGFVQTNLALLDVLRAARKKPARTEAKHMPADSPRQTRTGAMMTRKIEHNRRLTAD